MKILFFVFLFLFYSRAQGQDLRNSEWIQVKSERKDGSRIVSYQPNETSITKYLFKERTVMISINNQFVNEVNYNLIGNVLSIGEFVKYKIDSVNSELLVLTTVAKKELPDDKINRYYFVNNHFLFNYLNKEKKIFFGIDSLIEYNSFFSPTYYADFNKLFNTVFNSHSENKSISGRFIINFKGEIKNIEFDLNSHLSKEDAEKIKGVINSTSGNWSLPESPNSLNFQIYFVLSFSFIQSFSGVCFILVQIDSDETKIKSITFSELSQADAYFNRAMTFLKHKKYDKAILQFNKCIEIDEIYLDAYYNLAICYYQLNLKDKACETWLKLKNFGQKRAENLYNQNCQN